MISGTRAIYGPATPVGTTGPILIDNAGRILGGTGVTHPSAAGIWLPDGGTITIGESVQLGYVDQSRDALDANKTVWEEISGGNEIIYLGKREINSS